MSCACGVCCALLCRNVHVIFHRCALIVVFTPYPLDLCHWSHAVVCVCVPTESRQSCGCCFGSMTSIKEALSWTGSPSVTCVRLETGVGGVMSASHASPIAAICTTCPLDHVSCGSVCCAGDAGVAAAEHRRHPAGVHNGRFHWNITAPMCFRANNMLCLRPSFLTGCGVFSKVPHPERHARRCSWCC